MSARGAARPRFSTVVAGAVVALAALLVGAAVLLDVGPGGHRGTTVVTLRLWDPGAAEAYRRSLREFSAAHPDIEVQINLVAYANYFDALRTDVAGGGADDIFWVSAAYLADYADNGKLLAIGDPHPDWEPAVVQQFTRHGVLWAVPQLTDGGIAVFYNAELLAAAGVAPAELATLRWAPDDTDTLRRLLARLTVDAAGRRADSPGFDPARVRQWGYNAANDMQAIYLNYIGSAGGRFRADDTFVFDNPAAVTAFDYLVGLINDAHVAPPASATNTNGDFSRNRFLAGRMALFQSGTYNLAAVAEQADFDWGVALLPAGPAGRVSVTNGIAAAANAATAHPQAVRSVLAWLGSREGNRYLGLDGTAIPAVIAAQREYFAHWEARGVDVGPFFAVLDGPRIPAPGGAGFAAGFAALSPYFDEMFLGHTDVATALARAQRAANAAGSR
ncbi:extracellular solute-binding protein [Mycolicibacillus parakoreensis]|uniref:Extracellular solute-binding protein n=1 Tax=Mycolicibacillus parakoreensis TaxID=1069221 RepID=A0ABY3U7G0_9MYCO|nr:extracellular solute-binding protein [Mycolicibacillus parakoreensis]MCV7317458.1 extracellular solute-binding protein [Mycolicibacillus parakoreensis]ULN53921.1 extracellular solute-binding protein [Mycolicibacillus parakoreensis]HLR99591.1 extracellular solute-binding protein [Mycolicibacillus parakoreensis]